MDKNEIKKEVSQKVAEVKKRAGQETAKIKKEMEKVKKEAAKMTKRVEEYMKKNPGKAAAISAGAGALLGASLAVILRAKSRKKKAAGNSDKKK